MTSISTAFNAFQLVEVEETITADGDGLKIFEKSPQK